MKITKKTIVEFINNDEYTANEIDFITILDKSFNDSKIYYAFSINEISFYKYSETLKFWKKTKIEEVEKEVWGAYLLTVKSLRPNKKTLYESNKVKTNFIFNMTLERMKKFVKSFGVERKGMPDTTSAKYIPLLNGYIDINTLEFNPLDKYIYNRYVLPFEYKEDTKKPKLFLDFLEQIQPNEEHREFLLNWLSYMLIPSNPRQKALFMLGAGRNGKGVLVRIMTEILGKDNTSSLTIPQLSADTYHIATIVNSLVNFSPDNDTHDKLHIGTFKTVTGGDRTTVRNIRGENYEMIFL
jgi:phage/plasmid-associated DNA primase